MAKLNEMTTEQLVHTLCELTPPLCRILNDPRTQKALDRLLDRDLSEVSLTKAWARVLECLVPTLLGTHWEDMCQITGILTGLTPEQVSAGSGTDIMAALRMSWTEDIWDFFVLCRIWGQDAVLCAVSGLTHPVTMDALSALLYRQARDEMRADFEAQMLWELASAHRGKEGNVLDFPDWQSHSAIHHPHCSARSVRNMVVRLLREVRPE